MNGVCRRDQLTWNETHSGEGYVTKYFLMIIINFSNNIIENYALI